MKNCSNSSKTDIQECKSHGNEGLDHLTRKSTLSGWDINRGSIGFLFRKHWLFVQDWLLNKSNNGWQLTLVAIYRSININRKHTSNILYYLSLSPPHPHDFTGRTLVIANIFSWQYNQIDDIRINDELMGQCFLCWDTNTYLSEGQEWIQREVEKWTMPPPQI